jgi:hypothetical protein
MTTRYRFKPVIKNMELISRGSNILYRKVVLAQPDKMPRDEFIIKAMDWVLLLPERK